MLISIARMLFVALLSINLLGTTNVASGGRNLKRPQVFKTIKTEDGDIIDCMDIYKQPSLNHPKLKNHKIQLKPTRDMKEEFESFTPISQLKQTWLKSGSCPEGTIPLQRSRSNIPAVNTSAVVSPISNYTFGRKDEYPIRIEYAMPLSVQSPYTGTRADIYVSRPQVSSPDEYSMARILIASQANGIRPPRRRMPDIQYIISGGWMVNSGIFVDTQPRLFISWTKDNEETTGCWNLFCDGFIQTSNSVVLGGAFDQTSIGVGGQPYFSMTIHRDDAVPHWWIYYQDIELGYYAADLFDGYLYDADLVAWGGQVQNTYPGGAHTTTQMGTGFLPSGHADVGKAAMMGNIFSFGETGFFRDEIFDKFLTAPGCYDYVNLGFDQHHLGFSILYGGPGGPNCG